MCFLSPVYGQSDPTDSATTTKPIECTLFEEGGSLSNTFSTECLFNSAKFAGEQLGVPSIVEAAASLINGLVKYTFLQAASFLLSVSAFFFEVCINFSVVSFAAIANSDTAIGGFIIQLWTLIRDILNISLIFILLWAAIKTIIGNGEEIKKLIAGVILFGVLTNFSLFLVKGAIDISNIIALEFYQQLRSDKLNKTSFGGGVASTIMDKTTLNSFFIADPIGKKEVGSIAGAGDASNIAYTDNLLYTLSVIIILVALSFIFIQAGFVFLARMIVLVAVMVFSPLMFAGGVFTPLKNKIDEWWENFTSQLYLAPAFFIILYLAVFLMGGVKESLEELQLGDPEGSALVLFLSFFVKILVQTVIIIFGFQQSLNVAKNFSTAASTATTKFVGSNISKGVGALGRNTLGRFVGSGLAGVTGDSRLSRAARASGNFLKDSSFDMRNIKNTTVGKSMLGGQILSATKDSGLSGDGVKGGFATLQAEKKKEKEAKQKKIDEEEAARLKSRMDRAGLEAPENSEFDNRITSVDAATGNRTTITRPAPVAGQTQEQADAEWKKTVDRTNVANKTAVAARKATFLRTQNVSSTSRGARAQAAYRAVQGAAREVRGITEKKEKLDAYTKDLKEFANDSAAGSEGRKLGIDIGVDQVNIQSMDKKKLGDAWNDMQFQVQIKLDERKREVEALNTAARARALTPAETARQVEAKKEYTKLGNLLSKAKNASKNIEDLSKELGQ